MISQRRNVVAAAMIGVSVLCAGGGESKAGAIVTPSGLVDGVGGNANNVAPFDPVGYGPTRTQQVFASSDFSGMGGPRYIDAIAFESNSFGATIPNFQITMSTTGKAVDGLSPVFANNTGADAQTVYQGTLPIFSLPTVAGSSPFGLVVDLQHPFLYDPSKGNLLVDYTNPTPVQTVFANASTPSLTAQEILGDSTSRVLGYVAPLSAANPYAVNDLSHGHPDTLGLATEFLTGGPDPIPQPPIPSPVPEPPAFIVMAAVAVVLFFGSRRAILA